MTTAHCPLLLPLELLSRERVLPLLPQPSWARAGVLGSRTQSLSPAPLPASQVWPADTPASSPTPGSARGAAPGLFGLRAARGARGEEDGVGCTYLGEFGAHQEEEEEAQELPGRVHVSLPPPTPWHAGPVLPAAAWTRTRSRLCWPRRCPRAFSTRSRRRAGSAARGGRSAYRSGLSAPGGRGGRRRAGRRLLRPLLPARWLPPGARRRGALRGGGAKSLQGRGGAGARRDPRARLGRGEREGAGSGDAAGTGCDINEAGSLIQEVPSRWAAMWALQALGWGTWTQAAGARRTLGAGRGPRRARAWAGGRDREQATPSGPFAESC